MLTVITLVTVLIVSIVINILLYRALSIQLKKLKLYETWITEYESWMADVRNAVRATYVRMKDADHKDWFFKDDEVGVVFSELLNLLKHLNDRIQK